MSKNAHKLKNLDRLLTGVAILVPASSMAFTAYLLARHIGWSLPEVAMASLIWAGCGAMIGRTVLVAVAKRDAKKARLKAEIAAPIEADEINPVHQAFEELEIAVRETPVLHAAARSASFAIAGEDELLLSDAIDSGELILDDEISEDVLELVEAFEQPAPTPMPTGNGGDNRVVQLFGGGAPSVPDPQNGSGEPARVALADALADIRKSLQA